MEEEKQLNQASQVNQAIQVNQGRQETSGADGLKSGISSKKNKRGLVVVLMVVVLAVAGLAGYNFWKNSNNSKSSSDQGEKKGLENFSITRKDLRNDFENKEKKLKSDVTPPNNYKERFNKSIDVSLAAIESGIPSQDSFKDLREDYFNIASSYSILGEYKKSEGWYLKLLEQWPKDYKAHLNLGDLYILMGQPEVAAEKFYDTMQLYPTDHRVYSKLADLYVKYSKADDALDKADEVYRMGIKNADNPRSIYKSYSFFLENYMKDYKRALEMEREYQKISGEVNESEILRLKGLVK